MIINGPPQVVFADGSSQQAISLTETGVSGAASLTVTAIPSQVVSIRKSASGSALAVGAVLTTAEATSLVATRTASGGSSGTPIQKGAVVTVKYRFFPSGGTAPSFTVGDQAAIDGVHNGNFWIPGYPDSGSGTRTVDMLFDIGSAMSLSQVNNWVMQLNYGGGSTSSWPGIIANAITSSDGTTVTVLNQLTLSTASGGDANAQRSASGSVSGASTGRWVGLRFSNVPLVYPLIFQGFDSVQGATGGAFPQLSSPVTFSVHGTDSGSGTGTSTSSAAAVGVKYRFAQTGSAVPAFITGDQTAIDAVHNSNFWIPNFPTPGTGTFTVDLLFDLGSALTLTQLTSLQMSLNYAGQTTDQWAGAQASAIASTDGIAITVLNALSLASGSTDPNTLKTISGAVSGAPSARYFGVRLTGVPAAYPAIFRGYSIQTGGVAGSSADFTVRIGDSSTSFSGGTGTGTPTGNPVVYGDPGTRFPLAISLKNPATSYALTIPSGLSLVVQGSTAGTVTVGSAYTTANASGPFAPTETGAGVTSQSLQIFGTGKTFDGTYLSMAQNTYLATQALGIGLTTTSNVSTSQSPPSLTLEFVGVIPADARNLCSILSYSEGGMILYNGSNNNFVAHIERNGISVEYQSISGISRTAQEDIAIRYVDDPNGAGGTITFLRNGTAFGPSQATSMKPRIAPSAALESNALTGNGAAGGTLKVIKINALLDQPTTNYTYTAVTSGSVTATQLQSLLVDARSVAAPKRPRR